VILSARIISSAGSAQIRTTDISLHNEQQNTAIFIWMQIMANQTTEAKNRSFIQYFFLVYVYVNMPKPS